LLSPLDFQAGVTGFIPGPLYHELPFLSVQFGLFEGNTMIVMEHFDASLAVDIIERHRPDYLYVAPINLQRIAELPDITQRDLSSLTSVGTTGSMMPHWVKRAWFDLVGTEHVYELYGGTEGTGFTMVNGHEWLERPGTVGRPHLAEMKILDEEGVELPPGEVGRIFSRNTFGSGIPFEYVGAQQAQVTEDGFTWIGDLGWMDEEGYLYLADRRADLIISGGANVFAAEVEGVLSEHPAVADIAVIGLPDDTWGKRVHAVIQPHDLANPPSTDELRQWCRERLSAYKCPKTWEFIAEVPRTEAGKMRRSALVNERVTNGAASAVNATDRAVTQRRLSVKGSS
jgi:bile acid-coenzyme A ligase